MIEEIWKAVVGHEGEYKVSNLGRVRSLDRLVNMTNRFGSSYVSLRKGLTLQPGQSLGHHPRVMLGRTVGTRTVHSLVLEAFVGPAPPKHEARHLDGNEMNAKLSNLEWSTRSRNGQDKKYHKSAICYKLSPGDVNFIRLARLYRTVKVRELMRLFNICEGQVYHVINRECHKDIAPCR